jgi:hypothetical protein
MFIYHVKKSFKNKIKSIYNKNGNFFFKQYHCIALIKTKIKENQYKEEQKKEEGFENKKSKECWQKQNKKWIININKKNNRKYRFPYC